MPDQRTNRRLAAILAADVVGYSALVRGDESGTLAKVRSLFDEVLSPRIAAQGGRIVKYLGDGLLAEFPSAVDAATAAIEIQALLAGREQAPTLRIGINVGDVVLEGDDIFGDGVNIAARVQEQAPPGGVCLSDDAFRQVRSSMAKIFIDGGERSLKNIPEPLRVWTWEPDAAPGTTTGAAAPEAEGELAQDIRFCRAADGANLAYASVGEGPPVLKTSNWLGHLELDWTSPLWHDLLLAIARNHRLVRYDHRGTGLSDWKVETITFESWVDDVEAVVSASGLDRFAIFGVSQGAATALAYAARHPEKVARLVIMGGFAKGWNVGNNTDVIQQWTAMKALALQGWGKKNPAFRQVFTSLFVPEASEQQKAWLDEIQRASASAENAGRVIDAFGNLDVAHLLPNVRCPTLVLHCRGDEIIPFDLGRFVASRVPNARFVPLESNNHILFPTDPAWHKAVSEITQFLGEDAGRA